jgi:hypothetical protein
MAFETDDHSSTSLVEERLGGRNNTTGRSRAFRAKPLPASDGTDATCSREDTGNLASIRVETRDGEMEDDGVQSIIGAPAKDQEALAENLPSLEG